jgi:hypothetical protein
MTRANRPRKLRKDYHPCGCCYTWEPVRARARQADKHEVLTQLTEVPDEERVFSDFRELPDDIWDSHGDWFDRWMNCKCPSCNPMSEEETA